MTSVLADPRVDHLARVLSEVVATQVLTIEHLADRVDELEKQVRQ